MARKILPASNVPSRLLSDQTVVHESFHNVSKQSSISTPMADDEVITQKK
jgi:hypothetical protein